jgi:large subunit ribosomal protein L9
VSSAGGPALDKRKIEIPSPIKTVGAHKVSVRLHPEVAATIGLTIVAA